jgi:Tfp pilus assembly protein PilF
LPKYEQRPIFTSKIKSFVASLKTDSQKMTSNPDKGGTLVISKFKFRWLRLSAILCLVIYAVCPLNAQIAGGLSETTSSNWGGNNYITGAVLLPNGSPVNARISIILQSQTKGEILAMTDDSGKFVFSRISPGIYTFVIRGDSEFETASQEVEVIQQRNSGSQTYSITIRLRYKAKTTLKPGVIRSDMMAVPKKALNSYNKALKLVEADDIKGAIEQLKLAVEQYPAFTSAYNEMGVQYMRINELDKADESFLAALKLKPDLFEALTNRGIVLFRMKKFTDAEPLFRSALKIGKESAICHYYLGRLLTNLESYDEAEKELGLALKLSENKMIEVHRMLANLFINKGDYKSAADELEKYLGLAPKAPDAEQLRGVLSQIKNLKLPPTSPEPKP